MGRTIGIFWRESNKARKTFIEKINDLAFLIHGNITSQKKKLSIEYALV